MPAWWTVAMACFLAGLFLAVFGFIVWTGRLSRDSSRASRARWRRAGQVVQLVATLALAFSAGVGLVLGAR